MHNPARKVGICPKLVRSWEGPFLVIKRLSDVTYRIQRSPRAKRKVVHFDRLKPYHGTNGVNWLEDDSGTPEVVAPEPTVNDMSIDNTVLYDPEETIIYGDMPETVDVLNDETVVLNDNNDLENELDYVTHDVSLSKPGPEARETTRRSSRYAPKPARFRD